MKASSMMRNNWFKVGLIAASLLGGCKDNPYPTDGTLAKQDRATHIVESTLALEARTSTEFLEGVKGTVFLKVKVPSGKTPQITFENLPSDAIFDEQQLAIVWTPNYLAANDPKDPKVVEKTYLVRIYLRTLEDKITTKTIEIALHVKDNPQKLSIDGDDKLILVEGSPANTSVFVKSEDFSAGPFTIRTENLPSWVTVKSDPQDPTHFLINANPDYSIVKSSSRCEYYKYCAETVQWLLKASDIRGHESQIQFNWEVRDQRLKPIFVSPKDVTQGPQVSFMIYAEDPNLEVFPKVTSTDENLPGNLEITAMSTAANRGVYTVHWYDIPAKLMGTTKHLSFQVCVLGSYAVADNCENFGVNVYLSTTLKHKSPFTGSLTEAQK